MHSLHTVASHRVLGGLDLQVSACDTFLCLLKTALQYLISEPRRVLHHAWPANTVSTAHQSKSVT